MNTAHHMNILDRIVAATRLRVAQDKRAGLPSPANHVRTPGFFASALRKPGLSFICEVKRASPSKGIIAETFPYVDIAMEYECIGASAISVLTEPAFFLGSDANLSHIRRAVQTPLLRKDFIIDPFQIEQAACLGADAILLICSLLTPQTLRDYLERAHALSLDCLVEAHDADEVRMAADAGARIIGVNNRDLRTFNVDIQNSIALRKYAPAGVLFVAESGIKTAEDVRTLYQNGIDAALVGETLMRAPDKGAALLMLRGANA